MAMRRADLPENAMKNRTFFINQVNSVGFLLIRAHFSDTIPGGGGDSPSCFIDRKGIAFRW
ncbi:MAG: hypothetical protein PUB99_05605, partial [Oscillospiraceae bacterium]|nr:hypothetical protein [Oscillospiraceae bacterium]